MSGSVGDDHSADRGSHREDVRDPSLGGQTGASDQFDVLLQLHTRFADLQKREHDLAQRLQRTEQERNDLRRRLDHAGAGGSRSKGREQPAQQFAASDDQRIQEIALREAAIDERQRLVEQQQQELLEQQQQLATATEELQRSARADADAPENPSDRSSLRAQIEREIEIERTALLQLQSTLEAEKQQHVDALAVKKREYDEALAGLEARQDQEREQIRESLIPVIESEFREKLGTVDQARQSADLERETTLEELRRQAAELEEQREEFEQRIGIEREQLETDFERQRHELQDEKALFQKRYRFQFDHLQQSRAELEESLRVHRREEQAFRVTSRQFESQLQLRMQQVDKYLDVVRQREESAERQARQARQTLREQLREVGVDRDRLVERQTRWQEERSNQQADLARQDELLRSHAQNLEDRRLRLEELRLELEDTHQTTLEMRMAVEEAFAQLAQATGADQARTRIEAARTAIADHYRHIREGIAKQRAEIESSQRQVQSQREEFRAEREQMTQWMAERDERQRARQNELDQQVESVDEWESKWRQARDAWKQERMDAEHVIRDLLRQLTALHVPGLDDDDVRLPLTEQPAAGNTVDTLQDVAESDHVTDRPSNISPSEPDSSDDCSDGDSVVSVHGASDGGMNHDIVDSSSFPDSHLAENDDDATNGSSLSNGPEQDFDADCIDTEIPDEQQSVDLDERRSMLDDDRAQESGDAKSSGRLATAENDSWNSADLDDENKAA